MGYNSVDKASPFDCTNRLTLSKFIIPKVTEVDCLSKESLSHFIPYTMENQRQQCLEPKQFISIKKVILNKR